MAGRIRDEDVARVRERSPIADVVAAHLQLRPAGPNRVKGLCPFHDEKTPSFSVNTALGFFHCFGCGEHGDAFAFVQKIEQLTFPEAVEVLASRAGVALSYEQGGAAPRQAQGQRQRLLAAHAATAAFYVVQLADSAEAQAGQQFLTERGFEAAAIEAYGVGYAPARWDVLTRYLREKGFTDAELLASGLASQGQRGLIDRFRGRLMWPIKDITGEVIGFGARKLREDDTGPKYLNTPETPLYRKGSVLYGVDLAKREIARRHQAVVVEGYTDVMAAHLSGVDTAIASCGTAFGDDHARLLRRLMGNHDAFHGEVIFTFDGDAAGQSAALKVFSGDQNFITQTYVAIEPTGLDPCDLRLQHGEASVRELVARRMPLYQFVMRNVLSQHDLDRADGRLNALRAAAPLVGSIRDTALVTGYARELAGLLGMDVDEVRSEVLRAASRSSRRPAQPSTEGPAPTPTSDELPMPAPRDRMLTTERETAKLLIQAPQLFAPGWDGLGVADFTHPAYAAVFTSVEKAQAEDSAADWVHRVATAAGHDQIRSLVVSLAVEALPVQGEVTTRFVVAHSAGLQLLTVMRGIAELKSRLQRTNPVEAQQKYNQMFSELVVLEARRKELQTRSIGALD